MKIFLKYKLYRWISILGMILFFSVFSFTHLDKETLEGITKDFIAGEVEIKIRDTFGKSQKFQNISKSKNSLIKFKNSFILSIKKIHEILNSNLPDVIATKIATLCTCRHSEMQLEEAKRHFEEVKTKWKLLISDSFKSLKEQKIKNILVLEKWIEGYYQETVTLLIEDIRIFSVTNFIVFLGLFLSTFLRGKTREAIFIPGILLLMGTLVSISLYIFGQNWFFTLLYNDFVGYGYSIFLFFISGILIDLAFNKARVTRTIYEFIAAIISTIPPFPC